jgi:hypothetical protein
VIVHVLDRPKICQSCAVAIRKDTMAMLIDVPPSRNKCECGCDNVCIGIERKCPCGRSNYCAWCECLSKRWGAQWKHYHCYPIHRYYHLDCVEAERAKRDKKYSEGYHLAHPASAYDRDPRLSGIEPDEWAVYWDGVRRKMVNGS